MNQQTPAFRLLSVLALALSFANPAAGLEPGRGRATTVETAGLDLSRPTDAETLYARIRKAAISVCRTEKALWDGKAVLHQRLCVEEAVESAVARANEPLLAAVHRGSLGRVADR